MIVNFKMKRKSKTILEVIRNFVLDFILYFVNASMHEDILPNSSNNSLFLYSKTYWNQQVFGVSEIWIRPETPGS